jgi:hypothetical protein
MQDGGHKVSRTAFEENLARKVADKEFVADIGPLLASGYAWNLETAADAVIERLIALLE